MRATLRTRVFRLKCPVDNSFHRGLTRKSSPLPGVKNEMPDRTILPMSEVYALLESHGLPHIRFHDLRHSCATMLLAKHVPLDRIREWLGHSDIKMTMRYAHLDVSAAKDEMAAIMSDLLAVE